MRIFGYGSLIWRPDFAYARREPARLNGFCRRFYQGSTDHRGVPGAPGRVVTLLPDPGASCVGMLYEVSEVQMPKILGALDVREQLGYLRMQIQVTSLEQASVPVSAWMYAATPENPDYLGPAPIAQMAHQIATTRGVSGTGREYLMQLARWHHEIGVDDPHVAALKTAVQALENRNDGPR
ncbi:MAG: gamma-glutamylcyclotransferase [Nannocystaceae bacterium]|mgnify:CR=1 FL=1